MSDFAELKKRVDEFLKEIRVFSSVLKGGDEAIKQQNRYTDLRSKKNAFVEEVESFEPAKKILMLDSKKSSIVKSLQDEIVKAEKAMVKVKIEVPKDDQDEQDEEDEEDTEDKTGKADKKDDAKGKKGKKDDDKDKKENSKAKKSNRDEKRGKNKTEITDDDRKSTSSAKASRTEDPENVDNEFEDTDEEAEQAKAKAASSDKNRTIVTTESDEEEELEDVEEDRVSATSREAEAANTQKKDSKSGGKNDKKKDKKNESPEGDDPKKDNASKKGDKKARKDSEKSVAEGKEPKKGKEKKKEGKKSKNETEDKNSKEAEEADGDDEKERKKSGKSKKDKKDKTKEGKGSEKEKNKSKAADEEEEEEVPDEDEAPKSDAKKEKRKSKEIKEPKEGKKDKKSKVDPEKQDKEPKEKKEKDGTKKAEKEESKDKKGKEKPESKDEKEESKDKKGKGKSESKDEKEESKDKKGKGKSESKDEKEESKDKKGKGKSESKDEKEESKEKTERGDKKEAKQAEKMKADEVREVAVIHQEPKQRATAAGQSAALSAGLDEADGFASDEDDEEEFQEESEDEDDAPEVQVVIAKQASGVQSAAAPTPAPRQKPAEGPAAAPTRTAAAAARVETEEDDDEGEFDEDEEEEESEYEFEDMRTLGLHEPSKYEVLHAHSDPSDPDIMSIRVGELLSVLKVGPSGWWLARNAQGHEGLVPSTMLRLVRDEDSEGSELDEVTQADTTIGTSGPDELSRTGPTEGDESEDEADDVITAGDRDDHELERIAAGNQPTPPGLPAGFRVSSLARWFYKGTRSYPGRQFTLQSALQPKLTASCMSLQDGWGCSTQVRPVASRIERLVLLQKCQAMPTGMPVTVLDRFVRLCLFDGSGPVSNVHTIRATVAKDDRAWSFGTRATDAGSSLDYGEVYLRYNCASNQVRLLVEATIVCRSEATGPEPMELSIGHAVVPLFDETGGPLPAKAHDLQFEGGTPFDQQQEVDPSLGQSGGSSQKGGAGARSQPRIQLKLSVPNKETKEFMDTCPGTILGNLANLQLHSLYRQVLASELGYSSRIPERSASPIYAPHLVQFPAMADQPDLMDIIRKRWNEFAKRDRAFKKPVVSEVMKQEFVRIAKSTFFLNQLKNFQPYVFGDKIQEQMRSNLIQDFLRKIATDQTAVNFSLSADLAFEPFSLDEVALSIIGQFPMPVLPVSAE